MDMSLSRTAVLNIVGLSSSLIDRMPRLKKWSEGKRISSFKPEFPAVTCVGQSDYLTGLSPAWHGIVGNGWYNREMSEIQFWKQSNKIVKGPRIWDVLKEKHGDAFTCAKLFWWYNMYATVDWSITPRPMYPADGRKVFDIYTQPMEMREEIKKDLGEFPFPWFWGPASDIPSSRWIAESAKWVERQHEPVLSLVYLPHLDYSLQKIGPGHEQISRELEKIDEVIGGLLDFYEERKIGVVVLSEYGISPVSKPVYLNRQFRKKGWLAIKPEMGREMMDAGASRVFAVADHQVAHVYVNDESLKGEVLDFLKTVEGVDEVRIPEKEWEPGPGRERAGDFIAVAEEDAWFSYYYWEDDALAPDFARCVDIHRKPGYDPVELYIDPKLKMPKWKSAKFLLKKKLGFRALMDVIPLDASLVKGSHGRDQVPAGERPVFISDPSLPEVASPLDVFPALIAAVERS